MSAVVTEKKLKIVGTSPDRPDGVPKLTGTAQYGADYNLPGMLWGKILRSPHAHARIKKIDASKNKTDRLTREVESSFYTRSLLASPIPAIMLGLLVWLFRKNNEQRDIAPTRRIAGRSGGTVVPRRRAPRNRYQRRGHRAPRPEPGEWANR